VARKDRDADQRIVLGDHGNGRRPQSTGDYPHRERLPFYVDCRNSTRRTTSRNYPNNLTAGRHAWILKFGQSLYRAQIGAR